LSESTCQEQRISVTACVHQMEVGDKATAVDSSGTFGHLILSSGNRQAYDGECVRVALFVLNTPGPPPVRNNKMCMYV